MAGRVAPHTIENNTRTTPMLDWGPVGVPAASWGPDPTSANPAMEVIARITAHTSIRFRNFVSSRRWDASHNGGTKLVSPQVTRGRTVSTHLAAPPRRGRGGANC